MVKDRHAEVADEVEQMMIFRVGTLSMALPAHAIVGLHPPEQPSPVPLAPEHIPGIANLRGEVVPLLDLGKFLGLDDLKDDAKGRATRFERIAVISAAGMRVGIQCHEVRGVSSVSASLRRPIQAARGRNLETVATEEISLNEKVVVLLDAAKLLEAARVKT